MRAVRSLKQGLPKNRLRSQGSMAGFAHAHPDDAIGSEITPLTGSRYMIPERFGSRELACGRKSHYSGYLAEYHPDNFLRRYKKFKLNCTSAETACSWFTLYDLACALS